MIVIAPKTIMISMIPMILVVLVIAINHTFGRFPSFGMILRIVIIQSQSFTRLMTPVIAILHFFFPLSVYQIP